MQIGVIAGIFHFFSHAFVFIPFIYHHPINDPLPDFFVVVLLLIYFFSAVSSVSARDAATRQVVMSPRRRMRGRFEGRRGANGKATPSVTVAHQPAEAAAASASAGQHQAASDKKREPGREGAGERGRVMSEQQRRQKPR